jgi:hypothetical protein
MATAKKSSDWIMYFLKFGKKKKKLDILFTFWWMIWKERNRIIFENSHLSAEQLARMAKEEIQLHLSVFLSGSIGDLQ